MQQPFVAPPAGAPSPGLAAFLGLIPGVGAMYNGQFIKGLIHVAIFAVLVSAAHIYGIFGLFIAGWVCYQVFEAYHTAKARRDGEPLPDPLGLNEIGNLFATGGRGQPGAGAGPAGSYQAPYQPPYQAQDQSAYAGAESASVPGSISTSVSGPISGDLYAATAGLHGSRCAAAGATGTANELAAARAGWSSDFDCPGIAVSAGAVGLVLRPDV